MIGPADLAPASRGMASAQQLADNQKRNGENRMKERNCDVCGKAFKPNGSSARQRMCPDCASRIRLKIHQKIIPGICPICGQETPKGKRFCSDRCYNLAHRVQAMDNGRQWRLNHPVEPKPSRVKLPAKMPAPEPEQAMPHHPIDRKAFEAKKRHMSYGQYTAMMRLKRKGEI